MEVAKMRDVLLVAAGLFGGMWVFQLYTAFLPEFFRSYRGMSMAEASLMTQVLPFTGLFAALGGGIGTGMSGLRKPFTWPIAIHHAGRMRRRDHRSPIRLGFGCRWCWSESARQDRSPRSPHC